MIELPNESTNPLCGPVMGGLSVHAGGRSTNYQNCNNDQNVTCTDSYATESRQCRSLQCGAGTCLHNYLWKIMSRRIGQYRVANVCNRMCTHKVHTIERVKGGIIKPRWRHMCRQPSSKMLRSHNVVRSTRNLAAVNLPLTTGRGNPKTPKSVHLKICIWGTLV